MTYSAPISGSYYGHGPAQGHAVWFAPEATPALGELTGVQLTVNFIIGASSVEVNPFDPTYGPGGSPLFPNGLPITPGVDVSTSVLIVENSNLVYYQTLNSLATGPAITLLYRNVDTFSAVLSTSFSAYFSGPSLSAFVGTGTIPIQYSTRVFGFNSYGGTNFNGTVTASLDYHFVPDSGRGIELIAALAMLGCAHYRRLRRPGLRSIDDPLDSHSARLRPFNSL